MQIEIFTIQKGKSELEAELNKYRKMAQKFAKINISTLFNQNVAKAQASKDERSAKAAYEELFKTHKKGFCIALDENGQSKNSFEFADILKDKPLVSFFIGGAFGHSEQFRASCDMVLSLSPLTMAHKIAQLVLVEQIYRSLCINAGHPYHK